MRMPWYFKTCPHCKKEYPRGNVKVIRRKNYYVVCKNCKHKEEINGHDMEIIRTNKYVCSKCEKKIKCFYTKETCPNCKKEIIEKECYKPPEKNPKIPKFGETILY